MSTAQSSTTTTSATASGVAASLYSSNNALVERAPPSAFFSQMTQQSGAPQLSSSQVGNPDMMAAQGGLMFTISHGQQIELLRVNALENDLLLASSEISSLKKANTSSKERLSELETENVRLQGEIRKLRDSLRQIGDTLNERDVALATAQAEHKKVMAENGALKARVTALEADVKNFRSQLNFTEAALAASRKSVDGRIAALEAQFQNLNFDLLEREAAKRIEEEILASTGILGADGKPFLHISQLLDAAEADATLRQKLQQHVMFNEDALEDIRQALYNVRRHGNDTAHPAVTAAAFDSALASFKNSLNRRTKGRREIIQFVTSSKAKVVGT